MFGSTGAESAVCNYILLCVLAGARACEVAVVEEDSEAVDVVAA